MVKTAQRPSGETLGAPRRCIDCMSVAVIGRATAGEAAEGGGRGGERGAMGLYHGARRSKAARATRKRLERPPGDRRISRFTCSSTICGRCSSSHCLRIGRSISRTISSSGLTVRRRRDASAATVCSCLERLAALRRRPPRRAAAGRDRPAARAARSSSSTSSSSAVVLGQRLVLDRSAAAPPCAAPSPRRSPS